ncbi:glycoside hydrolase family 76 protein [Pseudarthrobacter sp. J64]|uniref:glycoside hydrolase family 76 protein n=1 Tax=Pseudarthrobacter sp. J64 TaxID=3116485 RepID=UPI002E8081D4|nr:glycoside hydrolase family 76 protein [Pseudarthrobacter sp. J64]MEE2570983.1 glycoside hydrolase family 76 protein [Pseudarthrobacter sp. J64]
MIQPESEAVDWSARADEAARSVTHRFGRKLLFLPGTHLAATTWPWGRFAHVTQPWHYWWQAHYLDALVDTGRRELDRGATPEARFDGPGNPSAGRLASRLLRGIRIRNLLTFVNNYFDDMAWLALASLRLDGLAADASKRGRRRYAKVQRSLNPQFISASTDDLGGGTFWSSKRDFKNTPATAPVALYFARTGQQARAQALVDWLDATLFDDERGLYLDGARLGSDGKILVEANVYTYNQGPILGALLELGGPRNLERAAEVIAAVERHLTVQAPGRTSTPESAAAEVLRCDGTGDRGLFTGILCRYLALAAKDQRLPKASRRTAGRLVRATAEAFWTGSSSSAGVSGSPTGNSAHSGDGSPYGRVFAIHATNTAAEDYPPGAAVELSTQLQAWMAIEAAATLARAAR